MATEPVILVAGGGLAREALTAMRAEGSLAPVGILDDNVATHGTSVAGVGVVGSMDQVSQFEDCRLVVCAGHGRVRRLLVDKLAERGVGPHRYATVVHPAAHLAGDTILGAGSIVLAGAVATANVLVGRHVVVMPNAVLTHDDRLADYVTVCAGVVIGGSVRIGPAAYLGMGSSIRQGLTIGEESTLGMGAVLLSDLPDGQVWAGLQLRVSDTVIRVAIRPAI